MAETPFPTAVSRWAALRTAARWEKAVAGQLLAAGVPVYLPLVSRLSTSGGKTRAVRVPLFGGYVFCGEAEFLANKGVAPSTRRKVAQVLRPADPAGLRAELAGIADLLTDRELVRERVAGRVGDVVRITGGSLAGYQGPIVRVRPGAWRVVVAVSFLGARLDVEVDERAVERAV